MAEKSTLYDPLTINLRRQTQAFLETIPQDSPLRALQAAPTRAELLRQLSRALLRPGLTIAAATAFRPILIDLCARWLEDKDDEEDKLEALCLLVEIHPELFPVLSAFLRGPRLVRGPLAFVEQADAVQALPAASLHRILLAYYRILHANRELPRVLNWPLSPLARLIWEAHPDAGVRFLAIRCYALQARMIEAERVKMEKQVIGEVESADCPVTYDAHIDGSRRVVDGWVLPVLEKTRVIDGRNALLAPQNYYTNDGDSIEPIHPAELSPLIANVHGVLMLRTSPSATVESALVSTPSTANALRTLALHLSLNTPTLLTSPPSSGKSLLLSHLAAAIYPDRKNQIVTVHLADTSLDPRSLLGSYVSSPTRPGTFDWKEGVLVRAMREGRWVVFEDVDRGSNEVLGLIRPLLESLGADKWIGARATMEVPGRGRVQAAETFAIFATRSLVPSRTGKFPPPTFFGSHLFQEVVVDPPTHEDLRLIVDTRFPRLAGPVAEGLIRLWEAVRNLGSTASTRDVGIRELEKLCVRVERLLPSSAPSMDMDTMNSSAPVLPSLFPNMAIREDIFSECRDVFFGAGATTTAARAHLSVVAHTIADHLDLAADRRDWVLTGRTPELSIDRDVNGVVASVRVGNTKLLPSASTPESALPVSRPFAMHKPAVCLLSRLATAIALNEPVLLTGETGTGKTSVVTHLAALLRRPLISLNLSNQTESSDIVGGFKPVDARVPASALQARFADLFGATFSRKKNAHFEESVRKAVQEGKWKRAVALWKEAVKLARGKIQAKLAEEAQDDAPRKRRKTEGNGLNVPESSWIEFERDVSTFEVQHVQGNGKFAYGFVEGPLVKALRAGHWILLDEVNLASAETLECVSSLLHGPTASITLTEQGSLEPVPRHPDFRLFACMNPATDVGKKDLPPNIRSRFTEFDVPPPDADKETLLSIVAQYIGPYAVGDRGAIMDVAEFYTAVRTLAERREIADGSNHRPHFSMRTLARALTFAADLAGAYSLRRALWEGCLMAFTMILDKQGAAVVTALAQKHILAGVRNQKSLLSVVPGVPQGRSADEVVRFGPFYLDRGPLPEDPAEEFIMTPSVEAKLIDLARIIVTKRFPVLIEGPTSSGKTSSIEYLARRTGHRFVRINNHEHTDIQEYLGTYVSDPASGKLVFKDGLLVRALRNGDWIVLDELNLAPTDVLEALNRLLDDNRELVIPETQEVVRPHPQFMLFATQNPPGLYAGRKVLSRAFRNRFLEVHFEDVPQAELETILCQRCRIAPSYAARIVSVFQELQRRRQSSRIFESKHGFATLRDLFRWAGRDAISYQELAENGYMLLAERARREDDKVVVKEVLESIMKVTINPSRLYTLHGEQDMSTYLGCPVPKTTQLVWTSAMQRLFTLVTRALRFNEPVLLVGETGCGKTSVCQLYAEITGRKLYAVNCHQNTETADLIGGLRPLRNRAALEADVLRQARSLLASLDRPLPDETSIADVTAITDNMLREAQAGSDSHRLLMELRAALSRVSTMFEWHDGPLVEAMRTGGVFLMDEISLADDSVLERLNSVLEPSRTIVLAERGGAQDVPAVTAEEAFKLVATMNPGGDYGKKELSPALRNRFTEIWVPSVDARADLELIVRSMWRHEALRDYTPSLLDFTGWLSSRVGDTTITSLRDILAWVEFSNAVYSPDRPDALPGNAVFHHAAQMTFLDGLGSLPQLATYSRSALEKLRNEATAKLQELVPLSADYSDETVSHDSSQVQLGSFTIPRGPREINPDQFSFQAPTTRDNVNRVVRACQLTKPILLEGSPGVGKTSLVSALANVCGYQLCRINLSDQTDLIDLFGSDLPVEGGSPGQFAWKDAEFLRALQEGHWVLLDEMNLAPQAVLEGLNAVLDHRGTVYIPELGRSFSRHPSFRIFAAQNPLHQGGGRKGLPKSFLNRFTKVYVQELSGEDVTLVCRSLFPAIPEVWIHGMIAYITRLQEEVIVKRSFGREGAPWEFNLRDVIRWASQIQGSTVDDLPHPAEFIRPLFLQRFRTESDRDAALKLFVSVFGDQILDEQEPPSITISPAFLKIGRYVISRSGSLLDRRVGGVLLSQLSPLEAMSACIANGWLTIITGPRGSGKSTLVRTLAGLTGNRLQEIPINSATDASDILGSFEEVDAQVRVRNLLKAAIHHFDTAAALCEGSRSFSTPQLFRALETLQAPSDASYADIRAAASLLLAALKNTADVHFAGQPELVSVLDAILNEREGLGRFEWVDGPLVRALKEGSWVLLDGANLCNPSVLDRLNSLCENNGRLTLNERGQVNGAVETLTPHPNFRLFMCVDNHVGELSRAMRNRGVEIALLPTVVDEDRTRILEHLSLPTASHDTHPHLSESVLHFEATRRSLRAVIVAKDPRSIPPGALTVEDSTTSSLLALLPSLSGIPDSFLYTAALAYFGAHSVPPSHLASLVRLLTLAAEDSSQLQSLLSIVQQLSSSHVLSSARALRVSLRSSRALPMEIVQSQPLVSFSGTDLRHASATSFVALVRLFVSLHLHANASGHNSIVVAESPSQSVVQKRSIEEITALRHVVLQICHDVTNGIDVGLPAAEAIISVSSRLLSYVRYLQDILAKDVFDYSAVHVASQWLSECFDHPHSGFSTAEVHVKALADILSLSSGAGLSAIWSALSHHALAERDVANVRQLEVVAQRLPLNVQALRPEIFELMALLTLPAPLDSQAQATLDALVRRLETRLPEVWATNDDLAAPAINPAYLALELNLLVSLTPGSLAHLPSAFADETRGLLRISFEDSAASLSHLVKYQHILWAHAAGELSLPHVLDLQKGWLESIWVMSSIGDIEGPAVLLTPAVLHSTLQQCERGEQSLAHLEDYRDGLTRQVQLLVANAKYSSARAIQLLVLLGLAIGMVASCFESSYDAQSFADIRSALACLFEEPQRTVPALVEKCELSSNAALRRAIEDHLKPTFSCLQTVQNIESVQLLVGQCWIAFGRFLLNLYVPDTPIDPAALKRCSDEYWTQERTVIDTQLQLHRAFAKRTDGDDHNGTIRYLERLLSEMPSPAHSTTPPHLPQSRGEISRLHMFWSEVHQFLSQVLSHQKVEGYVALIQSGDSAASMREQVLQKSLSTFCQRLGAVYADFDDMNGPLQLSLLAIRLGLRVLTHTRLQAGSAQGSATPLYTALLAFPTVASAESLRSHGVVSESSRSAFALVLARLTAISFEVQLSGDVQKHIHDIAQSYEQALGLWLIDQARMEEAEREAQTLYRRKDDGNLNEAEEEEEEFLELFPQFEDVLDNDETKTQRTENKPKRKSLVDAVSATRLFTTHLELFMRSGEQVTGASDRLFQDRTSLVSVFVDSEIASWPDTLDTFSAPFQARLLHDRLSALGRAVHPPYRPYDFYVDENVPEARKAIEALRDLLRRLDVLIGEWPDQMVLQHLRDRCEIVMAFSLHSPLAKILSALESLLGNIDDWEMYAHKGNSLRAHQQVLIGLVVHWRRLELTCWRGLLASQAIGFESSASDWWFRLYDASIRGILSVIDDSADSEDRDAAIADFLDKLIPLLDDFLTSSPLGLFTPRLRLVDSMHSYAHELSKASDGHRSAALHRVDRVLRSTVVYYSQFEAKVTKSLSDQKKVLEKNIHDFIKLASWKDVNIHALRQSAQKTHRQLYKVIRKFRELLRQPVTAFLELGTADVVDSSAITVAQASRTPPSDVVEPSFPSWPSTDERPAHLANIPKTFRNFDILILDRITPFVKSRPADNVEGLATDIISVSKSLSIVSIPTNVDAARRTKLHKNLLTRKRKAWSDLLKELKRAGFSANVKPELLQENHSRRHLREQPVMPPTVVKFATAVKGEEYLHRVLGLLPQLRQSPADHHSDISTRELQRALMFIEHNFSVGLQTRASLAHVLDQFSALQSTQGRLHDVAQASGTILGGTVVLELVSATKDVAEKLDHALRDLLTHLQDLQGDVPAAAIPISLIDAINGLLPSGLSVARSLRDVLSKMRASSYPILLQEEHQAVLAATSYFTRVSECLRRWCSKSEPLVSRFTEPVLTWLEDKARAILPLNDFPTVDAAAEEPSSAVVDSLLVTVQSLLSMCSPDVAEEDEERDNYIRDDSRLVSRLSSKLNLDRVLSVLHLLFERLATLSADQARDAALRVSPFLSTYAALVEEQVSNHASWFKALLKLNFTLCSIVRTIAKDGFCQPQETEGAEEGGEGQETMEGAGLGEGTGDENVSKEIQDESQVEGLQGEENAADEKVERAEEGNAIEMSEDFGGEMQDVPEQEDQEEGEEQEDSEADPDEQIGDVDASDENAVDEKLWGDEQGPEDKDDGGKTNQDHSKQQSGESEMVAKEGEQPKNEKPADAGEQSTEDEERPAEEEAGESMPEEEPVGADGAAMDEHVQEADTLELPDDMQMDQDLGEQDASGDADDDLMGDEDVEEENVETGGGDEPDQDSAMDDDVPANQPQAMEDDAQQQEGLNEDVENSATAQADTHAGDGQGSGEEAQATEASSAVPENADSTDADGGSKGQQGQTGQESGEPEDETTREDESGADEVESHEAERTSHESSGQTAPQDAAGNDKSGARSIPRGEAQRQSSTTNPLRSLGDALKEISQRFDEILEPEAPDQKAAADEPKPAQVEYVQNDDTQDEMQALGPARQDEVAKLRELNLADEDDPDAAEPVPMDVDGEMQDEASRSQPEQSALSSLKAEATSESLGVDMKSILTSDELNKQSEATDPYAPYALHDNLIPKQEEDEEDSKLELEVREWQARGHPTEDAEHIWRRYESLTHDLSYALCEQLRLILEPTQATRLKGDYRTGKRLNMKKIIPYIASEYTKDKIWLRRTRPSQREYQVLIALDDSRSMAESHSVHLAFQTLALVSKALSRLEVGDVGIAKFGQTVEVLHSFEGGPFTDQAGAKIVDAFRFDQKATQMLTLLETSLSLLEQARERRSASSSTAADLWQMEIIISDGVCQDHERLRTVLRRAEEQRVMVVFIILDSLHTATASASGSAPNQNSIVSMNQVAYKDVNGRMDLTVSRYLDTFPFEYYVVVRDVEALPEVLSGTLKQFFERISEE